MLYQIQDMPKVLAALANWYQTGADKCSKGFVLPAITNVLVETVVTRLNIFEFFYDGTDPGDCFDEFFAFTTLYNDTKVQTYSNFLTNSLTNQQFVFQGEWIGGRRDLSTLLTSLRSFNRLQQRVLQHGD